MNHQALGGARRVKDVRIVDQKLLENVHFRLTGLFREKPLVNKNNNIKYHTYGKKNKIKKKISEDQAFPV